MGEHDRECLVVEGGHRIEGQVRLSGAKNAALPILAASLLLDGTADLFDVPTDMTDIRNMLALIRELGASVKVEKGHVQIDPRPLERWELPSELAARTRASVLLMGPLLHRFGKVALPHPGGCSIGARPIDLHLELVRQLGGRIDSEGDVVVASLPKRVRAVQHQFPIRTTGGTENGLSLAALMPGRSLLTNAHVRPEVMDLCVFLNAAGARVRPLGVGAIEINGRAKLHSVTHRIVSGDDEALTYLVAAAVTEGEVEIVGASADRLEIPLAYLRGSGVRVFDAPQSLYVLPSRELTGMDVGTGPYPGINSDMQPYFVVFCTQALGPSRVTDTRFQSRFQYVEQLNRMGGEVEVVGNSAVLTGPKPLAGADVEAVDLRAGGALVIAGLAACGETRVSNLAQIDRGYEALDSKLRELGARIERTGDRQ